ncbi:hypothetical protein COOONC_13973 [Cooperia oncophora]
MYYNITTAWKQEGLLQPGWAEKEGGRNNLKCNGSNNSMDNLKDKWRRAEEHVSKANEDETQFALLQQFSDHWENIEADNAMIKGKTLLGFELKHSQNITTLTFGGYSHTEESYRVKVVLQSKTNGRPISLKLWTRQFITTIPSNSGSENDPSREHNEIDVLIGMDHYWDVVEINSNRLLPSGLVQSNTKLGPVLSGPQALLQSNTLSNTAPASLQAEPDNETDRISPSSTGPRNARHQKTTKMQPTPK